MRSYPRYMHGKLSNVIIVQHMIENYSCSHAKINKQIKLQKFKNLQMKIDYARKHLGFYLIFKALDCISGP